MAMQAPGPSAPAHPACAARRPPCRARLQEGNRIYLVLEYCAGGDLGAYIRRYGRLAEAPVRYFAAQLAAGLRELRRHNVIHVSSRPRCPLPMSLPPRQHAALHHNRGGCSTAGQHKAT